MLRSRILFLLIVLLFAMQPDFSAGEEPGPGILRPDVLQTIFSGREVMHFSISWTGGIKIGDLVLELEKDEEQGFVIHAKVTDYGVFRFFYPVDDDFLTFIHGREMLPYRYQVVQREGRGRGRVTRRLTMYDQAKGVVVYRKNEMSEQVIPVAGPVHNEFSSFYITRAMELHPGESFMVPTFADKKRNEVKVEVESREDVDSLFGRVTTVPVLPVMKFKGLYDKAGDTVIWLTDDKCRVPVRINSRILIGSLTADLVSYANPACISEIRRQKTEDR